MPTSTPPPRQSNPASDVVMAMALMFAGIFAAMITILFARIAYVLLCGSAAW